mgnify:CR=1 FL=1
MPARRAYPAAFRRKRTKRRINGKPPTASPGAGSLAFIPLSSHHLPSYFIYYTIILPFVNRDLPKNRDFFVNCISSLPKTENGGVKIAFPPVGLSANAPLRASPRKTTRSVPTDRRRGKAPRFPPGARPHRPYVFLRRENARPFRRARVAAIFGLHFSILPNDTIRILPNDTFRHTPERYAVSGVCGVSSRL